MEPSAKPVDDAAEWGRAQLLDLLGWMHARTGAALQELKTLDDRGLLVLAAAVFGSRPWHPNDDEDEYQLALLRVLVSAPGATSTVEALTAYLDSRLAGVVDDEVSDPG